MDHVEPTPDSESRFPWPLIVLLVLAATLWTAWWVGTALVFPSWQNAGPFGDAFGGINALFSAFAFAGIIYTILLQRKELRYQRLELHATRAEIAGQREQMVTQNATLVKQQFDSTFFQMLRLHHDIVNGMTRERPTGGRPIRGREIFADVRQAIIAALAGHPPTGSIDKALIALWDSVYAEFQPFLGHYFRNFYHLIKLVHESELPLDKEWYTSLARAQLSTDEHVALFHNAIGRTGRRRFKSLIEKYHLLENMHYDAVAERAALALYARSAYGDDVEKVARILAAASINWLPDDVIATAAPNIPA